MKDTAAPGREESSTLLKEFPIVIPNPASSGSTTNLPYKPDSSNSSILILGFSISIMGTLLLDK